MKSEWRIGYCKELGRRKKRYVVYQLLDKNKADCDDNREMIDTLWTMKEAQYLMNILNAEYDNPRSNK